MSTHRASKSRKQRRLIISLVIVGLIGIFLSKYQTPYFAKTPAPVRSLKSSVTVQGKPDREKGAYLVTAVYNNGPLTVAQLLWAKMQPYSEILTKKAAIGDSDYNDYALLQQQFQQIVADHAIQTAFKLAGKPVRIQYYGAPMCCPCERAHRLNTSSRKAIRSPRSMARVMKRPSSIRMR